MCARTGWEKPRLEKALECFELADICLNPSACFQNYMRQALLHLCLPWGEGGEGWGGAPSPASVRPTQPSPAQRRQKALAFKFHVKGAYVTFPDLSIRS